MDTIPYTDRLLDKFISSISVDGDCWMWTGDTIGKLPRFGKPMAKRWVVTALCGESLSKSQTVSSVCGVDLCVNPDHFLIRERSEMARSRITNLSKTCSKGHELSGDNVREYMRKGGSSMHRVCVACQNNRYASNSSNIKSRTKQRRVENRTRSHPLVAASKKTCTDCGITSPPENFYQDKSRDDWLSPYCKDCAKAKTKEWYSENKDRASEYNRMYRNSVTGRSVKRASEARRNEKLKELGQMRNDLDTIFRNAYGCMCVKCNGREWEHVDHIIPVSWDGSSNNISNLQPLCVTCNCSKQNFEAVDYRPFVMTDELADGYTEPMLHL